MEFSSIFASILTKRRCCFSSWKYKNEWEWL